MKAISTNYDRELLDAALRTIDAALLKAQVSRSPFPHFVVPALFDNATATALLQWMETDAPWAVESLGFYIQHGCHDLSELLAGHPASVVGAPDVFQLIQKHLERLFGMELQPGRFELGAHRLLEGHRIGAHTDDPRGGTENYRLVVNLNSGFHDSCGGHLALYDRNDPEKSLVVVSPWNNSAAAMEFSDHSWHFVDEVRHGTRYSLLYSFWKSGRAEQMATSAPSRRIPSENELRRLQELLHTLGAGDISHSNRFLIDHLTGTCDILQSWNCDWDVCKAGLFHSILNAVTDLSASAQKDRQDTLRAAIGERSFFLIRLYKVFDGSALDQLLSQRDFWENGVRVRLYEPDLRAVITMAWASILEKARHLPASSDERKPLAELYAKTKQLISENAQEDVAVLQGRL